MKSLRMRKVLFAIVFLFIQCVSGVGVTEVLNETLIVPTEKSEINSGSLEKSNKIDEKEIFENGDDKANNLSERSFVWINTRFKTPLRTKIYNSKIDEWKLDSLYQLKKSQHNVIPLSQRQYPSSLKSTISFTARHPPSPTHQSQPNPPTYQSNPSHSTYQRHPSLSTHQSHPSPPSTLSLPSSLSLPSTLNLPSSVSLPSSLSLPSPPNLPNPLSLPSPPSPTVALFRPHHDIGVPCSMPDENLNKKTSSNCNNGFSKPYVYQKFRQELPKMMPQMHNIVNDVLIPKAYDHEEIPKTQHILNSITRSKMKETYGFPSLYQVHRSAFNNDELGYKPEDMNLEENLFADRNFVLSPIDGSDEDKLLERYIKHTLADNGVRILDDELHIKCNECNKGKTNPDCKCENDGPEIKSKLNQIIEKKTKQLFIESTTDSKNKMNEYDDSSNDETFSNKTMVDVLFTPNTINDMIH